MACEYTGLHVACEWLAFFGFQVDNLSPEWQYLFDEAGVTSEMLRNKRSLQFILDTVYEIGPPQKLPTISSSKS